MPGFGQITPAQAMRRIGIPDAPLIIYVRSDDDLAALPRVIPTTRRVAHTAIATLPAPGAPWVTRHRPKIDRIACPWLIRRFISPSARFLFVAPTEVAEVADRFGAIPFDIEGVAFSDRGDQCTFDALLDDFGLHTDALDRMANVIRAADTDRHDLAPQAAGLLALSVGLSRMCHDDLTQLSAGIALYDALYRWARDGHEEGHDWPEVRKA
ncbi:chromate resistance protein ChrB domain-containing protein [Tabrizicola sp.]|uniref:chromate resistance protein ChrB domain-containing protein n=1 Tax=Tabrizicola sp. TaxID=2005166 RepID=UPI00261804BE|nr:chromate resistance protein ChrB domain-containing protein [Tabrizicola sp.]MDM7931912.1 chromate resistance protein [Tabrizicola sp.]